MTYGTGTYGSGTYGPGGPSGGGGTPVVGGGAVVHAAYSETVDYVAPDGTVYPLHVPSAVGRWVFSEQGWGLPPINYITQKGPFQHGVSVKDFILEPRAVQLLIRQQFCSREEYWSGRAALLAAIRPNRQATPEAVQPGQLIKRLPDGSRRALDVFIAQGPNFEPRVRTQWDEWAFQEVLRFIAHNPVAYDPSVQTSLFQTDPDLVFPVTFPILFGSLDDTQGIDYSGTWIEYPSFEITGPVTGVDIHNETTDERIVFTGQLLSGQTLTISLSYGNKTVTRDDGTNLIGSITSDSDLGTFHLESGMINTIRVLGSGSGSTTSAVMRYFNRYIGI